MTRRRLALAGALAFATATAHASLFDRGGGLIYDDVLNITWLQDANYAQTSGYNSDGDGLMNWSPANAWAAGLSFGGYEDWRLPTALNQDGSWPCAGYNCTNSEMGHMFYNNLGASAGSSVLTGTNTANLALFTNLQTIVYWSSTAYAPVPAGDAWYFGNGTGYQTIHNQNDEFGAWAVRPGDVAAVPEPEAYALLMAGLAGLGAVQRRRRSVLPMALRSARLALFAPRATATC